MSKGVRLEDLAGLAGVSTATVSRALNDSPLVNDRTKQRIWALAHEHGYAFRRPMPAGPIGARGAIVVVIAMGPGRHGNVGDPFSQRLAVEIGQAARDRGCDCTVSHFAPRNLDDLKALMVTSRADGVIFLGQNTLHDALNALARSESRFVVWGAQLDNQRYSSVGSDNPLGGRRAAAHLARLGRRRIVFLGDVAGIEARQRREGYLRGLEAAGITPDPDLILGAHFDVEEAEVAMNAFLARRLAFDGVVAANDMIAIGAIRALAAAGLAVPGDVSVVGYDDIPFARYVRPALTTISQHAGTAARIMVAKLLDAGGEAPRSERLPTELIVRDSCGG